MRKSILMMILLVTCVGTIQGQTKVIPIGVKVEAEGGGVSQGVWTQSAKDLTPSELKTLESLIVVEIKKQEGIKI